MVTEYLLPGSADEAAAQREGAVLMAGGTTVMPAVLDGSLRETRVVGLARAGLEGISHEGGRTIIGACATLARPPVLGGAAGPRRRRSAGRRCATWRRSAATWSSAGTSRARCWRSTRRSISGRGRSRSRTSGADLGVDIVRSVSFNDEAAADSVFIRWARRAANSPAVVCVAVAGGRVAIGGVGPHPVRSAGAEAHLDDPGAAGKAAAAEVDPPTDGIASGWYRKRMTEVFVRRALEVWHAV